MTNTTNVTNESDVNNKPSIADSESELRRLGVLKLQAEIDQMKAETEYTQQKAILEAELHGVQIQTLQCSIDICRRQVDPDN